MVAFNIKYDEPTINLVREKLNGETKEVECASNVSHAGNMQTTSLPVHQINKFYLTYTHTPMQKLLNN